MSKKRSEYLSWDEYFMGCAILSSMRSKDPSNQIGACIVDETTKKILSIGYNGLTCGMDDNLFDWESSGEKTGILKNVKDFYVVHAERNAILNYSGNSKDLRGSTLYITWFPCTECTKEIIQVGIKKIVYLRMFSKPEQVEISNIMLKAANVEVAKFNENKEFTKDEVRLLTDEIQKKFKSFSD
ncbi:MAG: deaminase [Bacilli bacterium]|nr:deaminase [Bacilli bacterium]